MTRKRYSAFLSITLVMIFSFMGGCSSGTKKTSLHLEQWHGKWVFVNYWASWCESCQLEIPELNVFYKDHKKQAILFGVNYDGLQGRSLREAAKKAGIQFPLLDVNPATALKLGVIDVVPVTFVFNPEGKLITKLVGPQSQISLKKLIKDRE